MYTEASNEAREAVVSSSVTTTAKLTFSDYYGEGQDLIIENNITSDGISLKDYCSKDGKLIGMVSSKELELKVTNDNYDLDGKESELEVGVMLSDGTYEYFPYGKYIVYSYADTKSNNKYKLIANDFFVKLNPDFSENKVFNPTFPIKAKAFYEQFMLSYGIKVEEQTLPNENFIINEMPNFDGYTGRTILSKLAELFGSFAKMNRNNKCQMYLKTQTDIVVDRNCMNSTLEIDKKYGPVNVISIGMSNIEGENVTLRDEESILENGEIMIRIDDNPFLYTEELREQAIQDLYNRLHNFSYIPTKFKGKALLYSDCGDAIKVQNMNTAADEYVDTIILNQDISLPATRKSVCTNLALNNTEQKLQYISKTKQEKSRTEIIVDKQNKKIQGIISQIGDRSEKTTTITADIDGLNSKVEEIATLINTVTGKRVNLENCAYSEITELVITGDIEVLTLADDVIGHYGTVPMPNLAPLGTLAPSKPQKQSKAVYVSDNTYLLDTTLIHIKPDNTTVKISLPDFTLRTLGEVKDEFHIKDGKAYVIQKIGLDDAGYKYALDETKTIELGAIELVLEEGTNTLYMEGFPNATLTATYMTKNELANGFATKVELSTSIKETSKEIDLSVNKKLEGYSTTEEMNASINLTAEEINQKVSKKVGNDEIISKINQSAEAVGIDALKINLSAMDILNLLAGNTINLSSKNIIITSDKFTVDKDGRMTCVDGEFKGKITSSNGNIGGWTINEQGLSNGKVFIKNDGASTIYTVADLIIMRGYIMDTTGFELPPAMIQHYDFNGDGQVTPADYVTLQNLIGISMSN